MLKYLSVLMLLAIFVIGCTDKSNMLSSVDNITGNNEAVTNPSFIELLPANNQTIKKDVAVSKTIYGDQESLLEINTGYAGGPFGWISITANARFQRYSFTGSRYVTMSISDNNGTASFSPSGTWALPVIYNLTIQGIDLSVYMASDGNYYKAKYQSLYIEKQSGKIQLINAELPHFSRWGFIN